MTTIEKLTEAFKGDLTDYKSIPFWSWNNALDNDELVRQIEQMHESGIGGFIMHARIGLKTKYLGEKWFGAVSACLAKARELGMNAWIYDENGWPSGFVGGKLLRQERYRAKFLEYAQLNFFDERAFAVYMETEAGFTQIFAPVPEKTAYHTVYLRVSPANTDILNPNVVDAFIRETHEKYYKRFADSFGKELVGFFTDEPQYYRWGTPYTPLVSRYFNEKYRQDVKDGLVYLFMNDPRGYEFRMKYFTALNELYVTNFYKKIYDWCEAHHCKLTGHSVDEMTLHSQMLGGAGCMSSYEYEHIPGIDFLGRNCHNELPPKQVGSVASQLGFHQVLTETFGCSGNDVTPQELKSIAEYQYFHGVSLMCQHLYPYSLSAQGKSDHPPVFSKHGNWGEAFRIFNDHFTRLGYIISNTTETYDALIIHPMRSIYLDYIRNLEYESVKELEDSFEELLLLYRRNGIRYHFADERILARYGEAKGDKLRIGNCEYDKVIVPKMKSISRSTLDILNRYTGKLLVYEKPFLVDGVYEEDVPLQSNMTQEDLFISAGLCFESEDGRAGITSRSGALGDFIFIKNYSRTESATFRTGGIASKYRALDLEKLTLSFISDEYTLPACESLILVRDESARPVKAKESREDITSLFRTNSITENYLVLDYAEYSKDGKHYSDSLPMPHLFENLLREDYKGKVYLRQSFFVKEKMPLKLILEKSRYKFLRLNGIQLQLTQNDFDINFAQADITDALVEGKNEILYCVDYYQHDGVHFALFDPMATESLRNCLYYDTHIEPIYIKGDFTLSKKHEILPRRMLPPITSRLCEKGYPFFKGCVDLQGTYSYDGKGARCIHLDGRFLVAEIEVNGKRLDMALDVRADITEFLREGENEIRIRLRSSLRNLFGPLHYKPDFEPLGVNPYCFNMRGSWRDGTSPHYTHAYQSVPFGVNSIYMISC